MPPQNKRSSPAQLVAMPSATLSGRVITPDGHPADGITIEASNGKLIVGTMPVHTTTDATGHFQLDGLANGDVIVRMNDPKQRGLAQQQTISVVAGTTTTMPDYLLLSGGLFDITVTDSATKKAVTQYQIVPHPENTRQKYHARATTFVRMKKAISSSAPSPGYIS